MNNFITCFFVLFISTHLVAQDLCFPNLGMTSTIENAYRQSTTSSVANLISNSENLDSVFDGNGSVIFELGFARSIWVGGTDPSGNLKVAASRYASNPSDYVPGPIWEGYDDFFRQLALCNFFRRVWTINDDDLRKHLNLFNLGTLVIDDIPLDILEWPALGNPYIDEFEIEVDLAPFFDNDGDGSYDPLQGDYPLALIENPTFIPKMFRFYVFNDSNPHQLSLGTPLNMEFQVIDYVVDCPSKQESETSVFTRLKYTNKGSEDLFDFKIGIWDDTDLGCPSGDFIGCNPNLDASYVYNSMGEDDQLSCSGIQTVPLNYGVVRSLVLLNRRLESFIHFYNCDIVDPAPQQCPARFYPEYYSYLNGQWLDGTQITAGGTGFDPSSGDTTSFVFPDLPNNSDGWSMEATGQLLADTRTLSVIEAVDLSPGEFGDVDFADHVLLSQTKTGIDIFEDYEGSINGLKEEFSAMKQGNLNCSLTSTEEIQESLFTLRPNPASDFVDIGFPVTMSGVLLVHSMQGVLLESYSLSRVTNFRLPVDDYATGIYLITFQNSEGTLSENRFVKQ